MARSVAELSRSKLCNFGHAVIIMRSHEEAGGLRAALIGTVWCNRVYNSCTFLSATSNFLRGCDRRFVP